MKKILSLMTVIGQLLIGLNASAFAPEDELPFKEAWPSEEVTAEPSVLFMARRTLINGFFEDVSEIYAGQVLKRANELGIQNPPAFCNMYNNSADVRNAEAIQNAEAALKIMQQAVDAATPEDKADLQSILDRQKAKFDNEMLKAADYEQKATALADYKKKVNLEESAYSERIRPQIDACYNNLCELNGFLLTQLKLLNAANERQPS